MQILTLLHFDQHAHHHRCYTNNVLGMHESCSPSVPVGSATSAPICGAQACVNLQVVAQREGETLGWCMVTGLVGGAGGVGGEVEGRGRER